MVIGDRDFFWGLSNSKNLPRKKTLTQKDFLMRKKWLYLPDLKKSVNPAGRDALLFCNFHAGFFSFCFFQFCNVIEVTIINKTI
jgi:hypothetical protein